MIPSLKAQLFTGIFILVAFCFSSQWATATVAEDHISPITREHELSRRGHTYSFQIVWNGSNRTNSSTGSESTPDLDYTFKVEPQGEGTGFLIDSYDPRLASADLTKPLLGDKLNNTAPDESTFRKTIQNRRVILMGVSTISADRMFGASMQVLPGLEDIQLLSNLTPSMIRSSYSSGMPLHYSKTGHRYDR